MKTDRLTESSNGVCSEKKKKRPVHYKDDDIRFLDNNVRVVISFVTECTNL